MTTYRYKAFISYSHADEAHGEWLQRALENFRAPSSLVGRTTAAGEIPRRLRPIFRDRNDLPAAGNLNAEIQAALAGSEFQIVLCSPNAAKSRWVNEEVKLFKKLHGQERTLALIVAGEPGATDIPGREAEECFPPALRFHSDERGEITGEPAEPIAADARADGDGKRYAILKLAAGLLGVGLDDLVRRDARRRTRLAWAWTGASTVLTVAMGGLAWYANIQGDEARRMRGEAEGLVAFMIGDFHETLKKVGRLDLLEKTGQEALRYYASQDLKALKDDALAQRAKALLIVGEVDQARKDLDAAAKAYAEALETTGELLRRAPNDPKRIFDHAQSVFYVGDVARLRGDLAASEKYFLEYLRLAELLVAIDPNRPEHQLEVAYATSNLGALRYDSSDYEEAIPYFEKSVAARETLWKADPENVKFAGPYAYALSWLAYGELLRGGFARAVETIDRQLSVYEPLLEKDPENYRIFGDIAVAQRRKAESHLAMGEVDIAKAALQSARETASRLMQRDSSNATWRANASYIEQVASGISKLESDEEQAAAFADRAVEIASGMTRIDDESRAVLANALSRRIEVRGDVAARASAAERLAGLLEGAVSSDADYDPGDMVGSALALSQFLEDAGEADRAQEVRSAALARVDAEGRNLAFSSNFTLAQLYLAAGDAGKARAIAVALRTAGFRHPAFEPFCIRLGL